MTSAVPPPAPPPIEFDAERLGQSRMITFITPLVPLATVWLRAVFALTSKFPELTKIRPLHVVHATQWSVLTSIPFNGAPQLRERPGHPYLIWGSFYNGEVDPYIEAFVATVRPQIWATWGTSYNYPGTKSVTRLRDYIVAASWRGSYSYSAYPKATVRMIMAAMEVEREHGVLKAAAATGSAEQFGAAYDRFLRRFGRLL